MLKLCLTQTSQQVDGNTNLLNPVSDGFEINIDSVCPSLQSIQRAGRMLVKLGYSEIQLVSTWSVEQQYAFAQAFLVPHKDRKLTLASAQTESDKQWLDDHLKALRFTRDVVNLSPEDCSPLKLAEYSKNWLSGIDKQNFQFKLIEGNELLEYQYHGIYQVGRGSDNPPALLEIDYNPLNIEEVEIALVGKGITYDSGGYSIKSSEGMLDMKCDMAGAATVVGALGLAAMSGLNKRVKAYLCCAENLISGHAYKLGDIIRYKNGVSVEIVNTDAEGRLVLADGLIAATADGAKKIIDAATLTGAAMVAVGSDYNALFSRHDSYAEQALKTATSVAEPLWRLPLDATHQEKCPSPFADTANSRAQKGGGSGGASNAAGFLSRFVDLDNCEWLHFDLAAAYSRTGSDFMAEGSSAIGIRTIAELLRID